MLDHALSFGEADHARVVADVRERVQPFMAHILVSGGPEHAQQLLSMVEATGGAVDPAERSAARRPFVRVVVAVHLRPLRRDAGS